MNNECNCSKSLSTGGEYPCKKLACIKEQKPDCMAAAVIPSITVETADGITNLANCLVHVLSTNTTYYVDDKHRILITWAGPVDIPGYDMETNPNGYKNQIVTDTENQIAVIYDAHGVGYTFGIEQGADIQDVVNAKIDEMAANGELADIVMDVLSLQAMFAYDTVADMKASENLVDGSIVETLGYHTKGDYGAATYSISDDSLTANGSTIIALDSGLFAVLNLNERVVKCEQFGAYGDGTHDDTAAVQSAINYSIAHDCTLEFNGDYLVEPTLRDDNTMVCLTYTKRNTGMQFVGTQMRFNRSARIKTDYNDDCTLLRIEARNIVISEGYFSGVQGKTDLLEFSRTNKLSTNYDGYNMDNIIENCVFRYGKNAIAMEGNCYYNRFTNCRIYSCYNGILMQMTALEKIGQIAESNVNRNDFVNVSMNSISNWGIRIEYGATNKFVNLDLEGCANGIYIDGPIQHTQDFPITPLWNSECNEFVNTMMESITTLQWYNNAPGLRVYGTTSDWGAKAQMVMEPQTFLGGLDPNQSVEKVCASVLTKDHGEYAQTGMNPWTTYNRYQTATRYLYDYDESGGVVSNMSLQNVTFDTTPSDANIASITYDTAGVKIKRIGGICFMFGTIKVVPNDVTKGIKLYFPSEWMKPLKSMYGQYSLFPPLTNGVYLKAGSTFTNMMALPVENSLNLANYSGNWDASNNILTLSLMWLAKGAVV